MSENDDSAPAPDSLHELHSIGDVATATGISVDTIRVWERRYGRPRPVRLPSGHRRYTDDHVRWLRRIAEALSRGQRPSRVVKLDEAALDALLADAPRSDEDERISLEMLRLVRSFSGDELRSLFDADAENLGPANFLQRRIAPLLTVAGRAWADGDLEVRHEHFLSDIVESTLRRIRGNLSESDDGPVIVLATLSDELHGLGLQMSALVCLLAGARPRVLGTRTPNDEIVAAAEELSARAVGISVSLATGGVGTDRVIADLRKSLPPDVSLVVGGAGARGVRRGPRGVEYVAGLDELETWVGALD